MLFNKKLTVAQHFVSMLYGSKGSFSTTPCCHPLPHLCLLCRCLQDAVYNHDVLKAKSKTKNARPVRTPLQLRWGEGAGFSGSLKLLCWRWEGATEGAGDWQPSFLLLNHQTQIRHGRQPCTRPSWSGWVSSPKGRVLADWRVLQKPLSSRRGKEPLTWENL